MHALIGLSGSHGTGKTSAIEEIERLVAAGKNTGPLIAIDHFKVSRFVLSQLGMTLEQATASAELTKDYQQKVLDRKIERDSKWTDVDAAILVDRSVADIYAYTKLWCIKNEIDGDWFIKFEKKCIEAMELYDIILLFPIGKFAFVDDGVRAKEDTQATIAAYIEEFIIAYAKNYHIIDTISVNDRANQILNIIKNDTKNIT